MNNNATGYVETIDSFEIVDMARKRLNLDIDDLVTLYESGLSELEIARRLDCNRWTIRQRLVSRGIPIRNRSAAMAVRMGHLSPHARQLLAAAANTARRDRPAAECEVVRKAARKSLTLSKKASGEDYFCRMLAARGIAFTKQAAVGRYNVDILCGPVAVEVHISSVNPHRSAITRKRIKRLCDAGLNVVYVKSPSYSSGLTTDQAVARITTAAADDVIAYIERTQSDPAFRRQYRVIRGSGELIAAGRCDFDD